MEKNIKSALFAAMIWMFCTGRGLALDCSDWNSEFVFSEASVSDVQSCLKSAEDLSSLNDFGRTPLMSAAAAGRPNVVKLLLDAGAEVNAPGAYDCTALHLAFGSAETVKILLDAGADVNARWRPEDGASPRCRSGF